MDAYERSFDGFSLHLVHDSGRAARSRGLSTDWQASIGFVIRTPASSIAPWRSLEIVCGAKEERNVQAAGQGLEHHIIIYICCNILHYMLYNIYISQACSQLLYLKL